LHNFLKKTVHVFTPVDSSHFSVHENEDSNQKVNNL